MEPISDTRFDPNVAAEVLLEMAHEKSVDQLLDRLLRRGLERTDMASFQIWLIQEGDLCSSCRLRANCPDQSRCLHLVAGKGVSLAGTGEAAPRFDDPRARLPLGVGLVGRAVSTGQQVFLTDLDKGENRAGELVGFDWLAAEEIRACGVTPIMFKGEVLGAMVGFGRKGHVQEEARPWGRVVADHIGAAVANNRAFEEIERLKAQLELQNTYLQEEVLEAKAFGDLVGQSAALHQVISQIDLVAPTEASVLIMGETGTGKELVAREIHRRSRRKDGPLVRVNCASIPRELFESEFFGHVRGSFTGAIKDRAGRFETAEGGTLFLDEIGEISMEMQTKLLRVLQEKRYERVGEDRTRSADVRVIGATNRDLRKAVAAGRFREDLYYRLNVFPIHVAPLRERKDDVPLLAKHFVDLSVRDLKCARPRLTRAGVVKLQSYHWPGNVRELRNVIERAVILARGHTLDFDLPATVSSASPSRSATRAAAAAETAGPAFLTEAELEARARDNLLTILKHANWKLKGPGGAAELLGVKPTTLFSRMKKLGLQAPGAKGQ